MKRVLDITLLIINPLVLVAVAVYDRLKREDLPPAKWVYRADRKVRYYKRYFYQGRRSTGSSFWGAYTLANAHAGAAA